MTHKNKMDAFGIGSIEIPALLFIWNRSIDFLALLFLRIFLAFFFDKDEVFLLCFNVREETATTIMENPKFA